MLRPPRIFRSSSEENFLLIGSADLALSTGQIDGGLSSRSMLEDVLVSVCDGGVVGVSMRFSSRGMVCGRELASSSFL